MVSEIAHWIIGFGILEFLIVLTVMLGCTVILAVIRLRRRKRSRPARAFIVIGLVCTLISAIHIVHAITLDRIVRYVEVSFRSPNWPADLNGYRIAFVTDFHLITNEEMRVVVEELNRRYINMLLLGGDFLMRDDHYRGTLSQLAQTRTTDGIFGVDGNHDHYRQLFAEMERLGIIPLDNSGVRVRDGFYLAGIRDLWRGVPNIAEAVRGANVGDFILLLTHNPDITMRQPTEGIDLIFTGHTHSGQITFFGFPLYLLRGSISDYGTRFSRGFAESACGVPVFTSTGIGRYFNIPRIFARPEVVIFTMFNE
ncbi:MAG: metallophosphoesterase [Defluviitaleaceae bacterium]|nr:metallophosphoesterase [Defluviitaleaceae bacterium]